MKVHLYLKNIFVLYLSDGARRRLMLNLIEGYVVYFFMILFAGLNLDDALSD